jgi:hypothetical protein
MKKLIVIFFIVGSITQLQAQKTKRVDKSASLTVAFGSKDFSDAIAYQHLLLLGKNKKLGVGLGVRLTNYFAGSKYYRTAPAKLTSGKTGPGVFFADDINANIDTILFKKSQANALNLSLNFTYTIYKKLVLGFNIDAIGFTFGAKQNGTYFANNGTGTATSAKLTSFNALLISDNDLGSLNSEFFAEYKLKNKWGVKAGFQFLFAEYTTPTKIQTTPTGDKNDRFRNKSSAFLIGITRQF